MGWARPRRAPARRVGGPGRWRAGCGRPWSAISERGLDARGAPPRAAARRRYALGVERVGDRLEAEATLAQLGDPLGHVRSGSGHARAAAGPLLRPAAGRPGRVRIVSPAVDL